MREGMKISSRIFLSLVLLVLLVGLVGLLGAKADASSLSGADPLRVKSAVREFMSALYGVGVQKKAGKKGTQFSVEGCPRIGQKQLAALLVLNRPIAYSVHFQKDCDIQGELQLKRSPFPFVLQLRNVRDFRRIEGVGENEIQSEFSLRALRLTLRVREGSLFKKSDQAVLKFSSSYDALFGYTGELKKNLGGEVHVTEYLGAPVNVSDHFVIR